MKEITLQIDDGAFGALVTEVNQKRHQGLLHSLGDRFLIRLLDSLSNNTRVMVLTMKENKISVRNLALPLTKYDDHRQARK